MSVTKVTECGNSNRIEKFGFQNVLHGMEGRDINIKQIRPFENLGISISALASVSALALQNF